MTLTDDKFWAEFWSHHKERPGFQFLDDLAPYLPRGESVRFLEVGCNPGGILASFGRRFHYELNGIDFIADPRDITDFLRTAGLRVGEIVRADALTWRPKERFDVVGSFGFIEHFDDALDVAARHFEFVKPGGLVVITMPNFARGQWVLHRIFDWRQLAAHNTKIMNLGFFDRVAQRTGARLEMARYTGGHFDFWPDNSDRPPWFRDLMWRTTARLGRLLARLPGDTNPLFSPYLLSVFRAPR